MAKPKKRFQGKRKAGRVVTDELGKDWAEIEVEVVDAETGAVVGLASHRVEISDNLDLDEAGLRDVIDRHVAEAEGVAERRHRHRGLLGKILAE